MHVTFATEPAPGHVNEDFVIATPDVAIVLDGAGLPEGTETGCIHGVPWYVRNLGTRLADLLTTRPALTMTNALAEAIRGVTESHADTCEPSHPNSPSSTVAAIRIVDDRLEWLVLADSTVVLDTTDGIEVITDERVERAVQARREAMEREVVGSAEHQVNAGRLVTAQRRIRNVPGGYWAAADDPLAAREARCGSRSALEVTRLAILSDGASRPVDRFGLTAWPAVLRLLQDRGPAGLLQEVRVAERSDPEGSRWPRSKCHDDASCVLAMPNGSWSS
jgi:hypothetical protein